MELEEIHEFNKAYRNEYRIESQILCSADTDIFNPHHDPFTFYYCFLIPILQMSLHHLGPGCLVVQPMCPGHEEERNLGLVCAAQGFSLLFLSKQALGLKRMLSPA